MDGYNRIKGLYLEGTCRDNSLKRIVAFLMKRPNMNDMYLNSEKNLIDMMKFVNNKAKEQATNNVAVLTDEEVYDLVIMYFSKSNDELGFDKPASKADLEDEKTPQKKDIKNDSQLQLDI